MSWLDRIKNQQLEIVTGDGSVFNPIWKNSSKSRELNAARFDFNDIEGTLVKRGKVSSIVIPYELWFQGDDHLDISEAFDQATKDTRPWTIRHPYYDELLVQPASLNINNDNLNVSVVTGEFWETIKDTYPDTGIDLKESVLKAIESISGTIATNYDELSGTLAPSSLSTINSSISIISRLYRLGIETAEDLETLEQAISEVNSSFSQITSDANVFMTRMATLARTPDRFYKSIKQRISTLTATYKDLKLAVTGLFNVQNKLYFESLGALMVTGIAESAVLLTSDIADDQDIEDNTITDYDTRTDVLNTIDTIIQYLNDYITTLGTLQTVDGSTPESYIPQYNTINQLKSIVSQVTGQLKEIAIGAKQERKYVLPEDMAIIPLVHRLYGLTDNDTINQFIEVNNVKLDEVLLLKKDREVIYYI